eukprot:7294007-Pyramimonas_sp.AAC.1
MNIFAELVRAADRVRSSRFERRPRLTSPNRHESDYQPCNPLEPELSVENRQFCTYQLCRSVARVQYQKLKCLSRWLEEYELVCGPSSASRPSSDLTGGRASSV